MNQGASTLNKDGYKQLLFLSVVVFMALGIGQDIWHAHIKNYHFYWYESLLFKSYWLCFLPFIWSIIHSNIQSNKVLIAVNVFIISVVQLIIVTSFIYLIAAVFYYAPFRWQNTFNYLFKQHFIETLLIYGVTYAFLAFKNRTSVAKQEKLQADFITVFKDKKHIPINIENVIFIQTNRPYISIHTLEQRYLSSTTLKQVLTTFKDTNLIRIHKSTVINIHHVKSYISRQNGDYDILMNNGITLRLSRTYARIFKEKMAVPPLGS